MKQDFLSQFSSENNKNILFWNLWKTGRLYIRFIRPCENCCFYLLLFYRFYLSISYRANDIGLKYIITRAIFNGIFYVWHESWLAWSIVSLIRFFYKEFKEWLSKNHNLNNWKCKILKCTKLIIQYKFRFFKIVKKIEIDLNIVNKCIGFV